MSYEMTILIILGQGEICMNCFDFSSQKLGTVVLNLVYNFPLPISYVAFFCRDQYPRSISYMQHAGQPQLLN